jgi:hypothetical protein
MPKNLELDILDFQEWIEHGVANGWISEPVCYHHDMLPVTDIEAEQLDEGDDPCLNVIRVWDF